MRLSKECWLANPLQHLESRSPSQRKRLTAVQRQPLLRMLIPQKRKLGDRRKKDDEQKRRSGRRKNVALPRKRLQERKVERAELQSLLHLLTEMQKKQNVKQRKRRIGGRRRRKDSVKSERDNRLRKRRDCDSSKRLR